MRSKSLDNLDVSTAEEGTPLPATANEKPAETSMIAAAIARLRVLPLAELRAEWHRWHPQVQMPDRLSRDLLVRTISWKLQEQQYGAFPAALARKLDRFSDQLARSGSLDLERELRLKTGTKLIREWRGETYRVTAVDEGFLYDSQQYVSLSEVARAITGTRWSGPRFFGLKQRAGKPRIKATEQFSG